MPNTASGSISNYEWWPILHSHSRESLTSQMAYLSPRACLMLKYIKLAHYDKLLCWDYKRIQADVKNRTVWQCTCKHEHSNYSLSNNVLLIRRWHSGTIQISFGFHLINNTWHKNNAHKELTVSAYFEAAICCELAAAAIITGTTDDSDELCSCCCGCDWGHSISIRGPLPNWIAALGSAASWNPASGCVPDCDVAGTPVCTICISLLPVSDRAIGGMMYWTDGAAVAAARLALVARWAAGIADTSWNELTLGWSIRLATSGAESAEMPLLLDNKATDGFVVTSAYDVMVWATVVLDTFTVGGWLHCDDNATCETIRDTASRVVTAGGCDRKGRNAAQLLSMPSSDDMDGIFVSWLDSEQVRSSDDVDALIGLGFGITDCEYEASTTDGWKSSTTAQHCTSECPLDWIITRLPV